MNEITHTNKGLPAILIALFVILILFMGVVFKKIDISFGSGILVGIFSGLIIVFGIRKFKR